MRRAVAAALPALLVALGHASPAHAWCRRTTPIWNIPVRVAIHPDMHNHIRHPFIDSSGNPNELFPCTTSAQCGTDGLCATGFSSAPANRCRGARWTQSELQRAVLWVVGRINNETPANLPFVYVDLDSTHSCVIDEPACGDADQPWVNCFQYNTITIVPSECERTQVFGGNWNGSQWVASSNVDVRNIVVLMQWSGSPGITWEHTFGREAEHFETALLHELGHALGLGHTVNDNPPAYPVCVPSSTPTTPLCPEGAFGTCPVMHGDRGESLGLSQHFFGFDDVEGLVALYGVGSSPATRLFEDIDISSSSWIERPIADLPLITDMAAAPRPPLTVPGAAVLGGREHSTLFMERFPVYEWTYVSNTTSLVTTFTTPGFRSTGPVGIAASPTHRMLSTHPPRLTADSRMRRRRLHTTRRPNSGSGDVVTTIGPSVGAPADTSVPGVSSFYHAGTDSWLHVLRDWNGQVLLYAVRPVTGASSVLPLGFRSFATPSIACSPNRCFIAFVEVPSPLAFGSTQTRLQWAEGTVTWPTGGSVSFTYGGVTTSWYNVVSDPVASVVQNPSGGWYFYVSTSWPQLGGGGWGTRILTYRKSENATGTNALLQLTPLLPHMPGVAEQSTAGGTGSVAALFTSSWP